MATAERTERRGFTSPGWLGFHGDARFPCVILEISQEGAKIAVKEAAALPDSLRLYLSPTAQTFRQCIVRWRENDSIGVHFETRHRKGV